jgi:hypothetical protein
MAKDFWNGHLHRMPQKLPHGYDSEQDFIRECEGKEILNRRGDSGKTYRLTRYHVSAGSWKLS